MNSFKLQIMITDSFIIYFFNIKLYFLIKVDNNKKNQIFLFVILFCRKYMRSLFFYALYIILLFFSKNVSLEKM